MRKLFVSSFVALALCAAAPKVARADLALAAEVGPTLVLDSSFMGDNVGFGFGARAGYKIGLPVISVTPELKLSYDKFPSDVKGWRVAVGGRASVGALIAPCAFVHFGYGRLGIGSVMDAEVKGTSFDIGAGLDFTPIPLLDLGVAISYNRILDGDVPVKWLAFQAQASLAF